MKKTITKFSLLILTVLSINSQVAAQSDLLMGRRGNTTIFSDSLIYADTTAGGGIVIVESKFLTTTLAATNVVGIYGMSLNPFTNEMYVVYGISTSGSTDRRLGIIDIATAIITDIAPSGNISDITFMDSTLYATTSDNHTNSRSFGIINKTTGVFDLLSTHLNPGGLSTALTFDRYNNRFLKSAQNVGFDVIDAVTKTETSFFTGSLDWTTGLLIVNDSTGFRVGNTSVEYLNTNDLSSTTSFTFGTSQYLHSIAFTSYPVSLWVNGARDTCDGNWELTVVGSGTVHQWYKDGVLIPGVSDSTYTVNESGDYDVIVDGVKTNHVTVVINAPAMSGVITSTGGAATGEIDITVAGGVGTYTYDWDTDGTGDFDDTEDLTGLTAGPYVVVVKDAAGCTGTETYVVNSTVGINELDNNLVSIFPNPTSDKIIVTLDGEFSYQLINATGKLLEVEGRAVNTKEVSLAGLANGVYFLRVNANSKIKTFKVIKK